MTPQRKLVLVKHLGITLGSSPEEVLTRLDRGHYSQSDIQMSETACASDREDIVALDWFETLPPEIEARIERKFYVGHFLCHVLHQEYLVKKGEDCHALEQEIYALLDARGAEYSAEHNVGHLYHAKPALRDFYRKLDPTNQFNPGIGKTSKQRDWR